MSASLSSIIKIRAGCMVQYCISENTGLYQCKYCRFCDENCRSETFRLEYGLIGVERLHIAVAEDNPSDVVTLRQLLDRIGLEYRLTVAAEGEEARDFILKQACSERERRSIDQHFAPKKIYYIAKPLDEKHLLACLLSYDNLRPIAERLAKQ